jgi:hypothetical protein
MEYPDGIFNVNSKDKFGMGIKGVKSYPCNISTHSRRATFERGGGGGGVPLLFKSNNNLFFSLPLPIYIGTGFYP